MKRLLEIQLLTFVQMYGASLVIKASNKSQLSDKRNAPTLTCFKRQVLDASRIIWFSSCKHDYYTYLNPIFRKSFQFMYF